jgi:AcrR family transcriptional regulator
MGTQTRKRPYAPRLPPAERREQLLDAALLLIDEGGYAGVSMEAIARTAGVTKPVVYDLFANIGELLHALLRREEVRAIAQLEAVMPESPSADPDELIVTGFVAFLRSVAANPATWRLIVQPAEGTPEIVRDHVEAGRESYRRRLAELLVWGVNERGGPPGVDIELAAHSMIAVGERYAWLVLNDPETYTPELVGEFVQTFLAALERPA